MSAPPSLLIVDGMNVIGSRPDGWWRDRDRAALRLAERLRHYAQHERRDVMLVLDGPPLSDLPAEQGRMSVVYGDGQTADDRIAEVVAGHPVPATIEVVTADRELQRRVREYGASLSGPSGLLRALAAVAAS